MKVFTTKRFTFEVGLFGPHLMYYKDTDDFDDVIRSVLVVSFILFRLHFEFSLNLSKTIFDMYGFKYEKSGQYLIFYWGDICKVIRMPWQRIVIERNLMDVNNIPCYNSINYCDMIEKVYSEPEKFLRNTNGYGYDCDYYVIQTKTRPICLVNTFIGCFDKISYEIVTTVKHNKHNEIFTFVSPYNVAIDSQINVQLMMRHGHTIDF